MDNEKVFVLVDKRVAEFLSTATQEIGHEDSLYIINTVIGELLLENIKKNGLSSVENCLRGISHEKKDSKNFVF